MGNFVKNKKLNLDAYKNLIETVSKVEFKKIAALGVIEYMEVENIAIHTLYILFGHADPETYNNAYLSKAIKWAIRNEIRRRYKWYAIKNSPAKEEECNDLREAVYKTILSIDELAEAENPVLIKDTARNPEEKAEFIELKKRIVEAMKCLPQREQDLLEAKFFHDKKLKDISVEFNISQSGISRIIQNSLDKIKKELVKQGMV